MISLPGLTLATGRADEAASILRTFARYLADGLLPNNFPDSAGVDPRVQHRRRHPLVRPGDPRLSRRRPATTRSSTDLLPALREIVEHHLAGTRYGIGVDPADGLLRAGEPGVQLTWMDAKVGDWVVTPRIGKPVEINALWYNALRIVAAILRGARGRGDGGTISTPWPTGRATRSAPASGGRIATIWPTSSTGRTGTTGRCGRTRSSPSRSPTRCSRATRRGRSSTRSAAPC